MNKHTYLLLALCIVTGPPVGRGADAETKPLTARKMKSLAAGVYEVPESHGLTLTHIASGEFVMGSPKKEVGRRSDEKRRKITISRPGPRGRSHKRRPLDSPSARLLQGRPLGR
jgi:hypothetical protein